MDATRAQIRPADSVFTDLAQAPKYTGYNRKRQAVSQETLNTPVKLKNPQDIQSFI